MGNEENPILRFERIIEEKNLNKSEKKLKKGEFIFKKHYNTEKTPCAEWFDCRIANLYPITNKTKIPENALDPKVWDIPEGYYAIEENLD